MFFQYRRSPNYAPQTVKSILFIDRNIYVQSIFCIFCKTTVCVQMSPVYLYKECKVNCNERNNRLFNVNFYRFGLLTSIKNMLFNLRKYVSLLNRKNKQF